MGSNVMCTSIGRREELDVQLHLVREKRRIEQMVINELSQESNKSIRQPPSSEEMAKYVRQKVEEKFPSGIDFYGRTVYVNEEVHVKDDPALLVSSERVLPVHDSLKRVYLGERGILHQVVPSFHGRPAATIRFADGAQKTFFLECLDLVGVRMPAKESTGSANSGKAVIHLTSSSRLHSAEKGGENQLQEGLDRLAGQTEEHRETGVAKKIQSDNQVPYKGLKSGPGKEDLFSLNSVRFPPPLVSASWDEFSHKNSKEQYAEKQAKARKLFDTLSKGNHALKDDDNEDEESSVKEESKSRKEKTVSRKEIKSVDSISTAKTGPHLAASDKKPSDPPSSVPPTFFSFAGPPAPPSLKELRETFVPAPQPLAIPVSLLCSEAASNVEDDEDSQHRFSHHSGDAESPSIGEGTPGPFSGSLAVNSENSEETPHIFPCAVKPLRAAERDGRIATLSLPTSSSSCTNHFTRASEAEAEVGKALLPASSSDVLPYGVEEGKLSALSPADPIRIINFCAPMESSRAPFLATDNKGREETEKESGVSPSSCTMEETDGAILLQRGLPFECSKEEHAREIGNLGGPTMEDPSWWSHRSLCGGISNVHPASLGATNVTPITSCSSITTGNAPRNAAANPTLRQRMDDGSGGIRSGAIGEKKGNDFYPSSHAAIPPLTLQVIDCSEPIPDDVLKTIDNEAETMPSKACLTTNSKAISRRNGTVESEIPSCTIGLPSSSSLLYENAQKLTVEGKNKWSIEKSIERTAKKNIMSHTTLGLVKHHLPPPSSIPSQEKKPLAENLGTPYTVEQLKTIGVAELLSPSCSFHEVEENIMLDDVEIPPLLEENIKLSGIPQSAPPGYKGKFSFYDTNTSIPRYVPMKPSALRRIMVAGFPRPQPSAMNSLENMNSLSHYSSAPRLRFVEVFYRRDAVMESILTAATKALGWEEGNDWRAQRLFTMAGNEVLWEENIAEGMQLIATQGNLYHPQRFSTEVATARAADANYSVSCFSYASNNRSEQTTTTIIGRSERDEWERSGTIERERTIFETHKLSFSPQALHQGHVTPPITDISSGTVVGGVMSSHHAIARGTALENIEAGSDDHSFSHPKPESSAQSEKSRYADPASLSHSGPLNKEKAGNTCNKTMERTVSGQNKLRHKEDIADSTEGNANAVPPAGLSPSIATEVTINEGLKEDEVMPLPSKRYVSERIRTGLKRFTSDPNACFPPEGTPGNGVASCSLNDSSSALSNGIDLRPSGKPSIYSVHWSDPLTLAVKVELADPKKEDVDDSTIMSSPLGSRSTKKKKLPEISLSSAKPFHIKVFENGFYDDDAGVFRVITVRPNYKTIGALKTLIARELEWRGGKKVDLLFDATGMLITDLNQIHEGDALVASAGDRFIVPYPNSVLHREAARMQLLRQTE